MKKTYLFLFLLLVGCAEATTPVPNTDPNVRQVICVAPESDNAYQWAIGSCVETNTDVYLITVRVVQTLTSHNEINAAGSGSGVLFGNSGSYSSHFRMWQDGKGILPVEILSIFPEFPSLMVGNTILLKTSDLKAMALPELSEVEFVCNQDIEVLSPNQNRQTLTTDRLTYELDDCRMTTPSYTLPKSNESPLTPVNP